jgi:hypothetical protein
MSLLTGTARRASAREGRAASSEAGPKATLPVGVEASVHTLSVTNYVDYLY